MVETIKINDVEYVRADSISQEAVKNKDGLRYCIVRTYSAGVFAGYLTDRSEDGQRGTVLEARRLWYWSGASSLSEASQQGFANPDDCKFPQEVPEVELTNIIEVIPCSEKARQSIKDVKIWSQH
jgi:hypothetical protein